MRGCYMLEKLPGALGEVLVEQRAGLEKTVFYRLKNAGELPRIAVHSSAFRAGGTIPRKYTEDGDGLSPPLEWTGIDAAAASGVLIVEDADSPTPHPLVHAIVVDLDGGNGSIPEGALNSPEHTGLGLQTGRNSYLRQSWLPPDPPPGHGLHRYVFQLFALRSGPAFSQVPGRQELFDAISERALAGGYLIGTYERAERVPVKDTAEATDYEDALPMGVALPA